MFSLVQALLRDFADRGPWHVLPWTASWKSQMQKFKYSSKPTASHMNSWSTRTAQSQGTNLVGVYGWAGRKDCTRKRWSLQSHDLQFDHGGRAVTHAIQWLASLRDSQITRAITLRDSMKLLQKVKSGMGCLDWHTAMPSRRLHRRLWIYCPGHARVRGNEWADRLASKAYITSGPQLGEAEVLEGPRNFLKTDRLEHNSMDRLKEREWRKEAADMPTSEVDNDLCSTRQTLALFRGQPCGDCRVTGRSAYGRTLLCHPSATMPSSAEAENETFSSCCFSSLHFLPLLLLLTASLA